MKYLLSKQINCTWYRLEGCYGICLLLHSQSLYENWNWEFLDNKY